MKDEITKTELAQRMDRDAKAFYKRYTAGLKILDDDRMLLTTFGVFLHNEYFAATTAREARLVEALEEITNPIKAMESRLKEGERLDGISAIRIAYDVEYLKQIATKALAEYRGEK